MPVCVIRWPPACCDGERDAEVGHQGRAVLQQDVLRLDVAVDHALAVGVVERGGDLAREPERLLHRQLPVAAAGARAAIRPATKGMT